MSVARRILVFSALFLAACSGERPIDPLIPEAPPPVTGVTLARDTATLVPGASVKLLATPTGSSGQTLERAVLWSSSDTTKAKVATDGTVTGTGVGTATIAATSETVSARATITVLEGGLITPAGA